MVCCVDRKAKKEILVEASRGGKPASCRFEDYGDRVMGIGLLGIVAVRAGKTIEWDAKNMRARNISDADPFVRPEYRKGWELKT